MTSYEFLLTLHIAAAILWLGATVGVDMVAKPRF